MNKEQLELIKKAYKNWLDENEYSYKWMKEINLGLPFLNKSYAMFTEKEIFETLWSNPEFSEDLGLNIEKSSLTFLEKWELAEPVYDKMTGISGSMVEDIKTSSDLDQALLELNLSCERITVTYRGEEICNFPFFEEDFEKSELDPNLIVEEIPSPYGKFVHLDFKYDDLTK